MHKIILIIGAFDTKGEEHAFLRGDILARRIFVQAAGAICGMVEAEVPHVVDERPIIAASMFGNTSTCVDHCRQLLTAANYEVLVFHATGTGVRTMESLIDEGLVDACLDISRRSNWRPTSTIESFPKKRWRCCWN